MESVRFLKLAGHFNPEGEVIDHPKGRRDESPYLP
jgi:hypothetical protein